MIVQNGHKYYITATDVAAWIRGYVEHIKNCSTDQEIKIRALAYETKLAELYPYTENIDYVLDPLFIDRYKSNRYEYKNLYDQLIRFGYIIDNTFPRFGNVLSCYTRMLKEVGLWGTN